MSQLVVPGSLVAVSWVHEHLNDVRLRLFDASLTPVAGAPAASGSAVKLAAHLPGALPFDFDKRICDTHAELPHMMPSPEDFQREVRALGVDAGDTIVIYDSIGVYASARAWWMLKAMGHDQVAVLDGGMPAWMQAGMPVVTGPKPASGTPGTFVARPCPALFCDGDRVAAGLRDSAVAVIDARSPGRFLGTEAEPRPGLRAGHMPGAVNLPFAAVLTQGHLRTSLELTTLFRRAAGDRQSLIFTCGSGVTACVLALAAAVVGYRDIAVYDGSWSDWGRPSARPVVAGRSCSSCCSSASRPTASRAHCSRPVRSATKSGHSRGGVGSTS